jgi:hypothetical protein
MHGRAPQPLDPQSWTFVWHYLGLIGIAIGGMAFLGALAMAIFIPSISWGASSGETIFLLSLSACAGAFVGIPTVAVVIPCLHLKPLWLTSLTVYGGSAGVVVAYWALAQTTPSPFGPWPLDVACIALISVGILSVAVWKVVPNRYVIVGGTLCPRCRYDLRGGSRIRCPECGWSGVNA